MIFISFYFTDSYILFFLKDKKNPNEFRIFILLIIELNYDLKYEKS